MVECIFCGIVQGAIPAKKLFEDDQVVAFPDINPQAPEHFLVIPKRHVPSMADVEAGEGALVGHMLVICSRIAKDRGLAQNGYRIVINTGSEGGQTVFHLHFHVLGGRSLSWPPG